MNLHQQTTFRFPIGDIQNLPLVNYEPAALREWGTGWQIEYRILNPFTGILEKKRIRFERIRKRLGSDTAARKHASKYCKAITEKLESGWNPYTEGSKAKTFHKLTDAFGVFLREKELDMKNGVFRNDSKRVDAVMMHHSNNPISYHFSKLISPMWVSVRCVQKIEH